MHSLFKVLYSLNPQELQQSKPAAASARVIINNYISPAHPPSPFQPLQHSMPSPALADLSASSSAPAALPPFPTTATGAAAAAAAAVAAAQKVAATATSSYTASGPQRELSLGAGAAAYPTDCPPMAAASAPSGTLKSCICNIYSCIGNR